MSFLFGKLTQPRIWERILRERLSEPLHLNVISLAVLAFGSLRAKIYFDLLVRQHHAFGLLNAADKAKDLGLGSVSVIEFGVANGTGLMNICMLAEKITAATGVRFDVFGFDTGTGMPPPRDYRDHPEHYMTGDFPMQNIKALEARLPSFAKLVFGDVAETVPQFLSAVEDSSPIGFVSIDVDYYWSTVQALRVFDGRSAQYLPTVTMYLDDITFEEHNNWCGELGAINDFNAAHAVRKIEPFNHLHGRRLFKNANWIDNIFTLHVLDHSWRTPGKLRVSPRVLENPYITGRSDATVGTGG
jgi:hypothetical protein